MGQVPQQHLLQQIKTWVPILLIGQNLRLKNQGMCLSPWKIVLDWKWMYYMLLSQIFWFQSQKMHYMCKQPSLWCYPEKMRWLSFCSAFLQWRKMCTLWKRTILQQYNQSLLELYFRKNLQCFREKMCVSSRSVLDRIFMHYLCSSKLFLKPDKNVHFLSKEQSLWHNATKMCWLPRR